MYISDCLAYENIEIKIESLEEHLNVNIHSPRNGYSVSLTLSCPQVAVLATAMLETLTAMGEVQDDLGIFGNAVRVGSTVEKRMKEAA